MSTLLLTSPNALWYSECLFLRTLILCTGLNIFTYFFLYYFLKIFSTIASTSWSSFVRFVVILLLQFMVFMLEVSLKYMMILILYMEHLEVDWKLENLVALLIVIRWWSFLGKSGYPKYCYSSEVIQLL